MEEKAFTAGVAPGGLTTGKEIKILLCYLFSQLEEPLSHPLLTSALTKEGIVNYFECADALSDLLRTENLAIVEESLCSVTPTGRNIADNLYRELPITVRERALVLAKNCLVLQRNQKQHRTEIREIKDGFLVRCYLSDGSIDLFSVELYAPNRHYAQNIERNFIMNGESLIRSVIEQLTTESEDD